jgi:hypothetical protein
MYVISQSRRPSPVLSEPRAPEMTPTRRPNYTGCGVHVHMRSAIWIDSGRDYRQTARCARWFVGALPLVPRCDRLALLATLLTASEYIVRVRI